MAKRLSKELEEIRKQVEDVAKECGLDFFPTEFYTLNLNELNAITANIGFPTRYVHWQFGMEYIRFKRQLEHGFSRIYELVINNNPAIAYMLEDNHIVQQKMVMAHVYGHVDFFKNNYMFEHTDRNMLNRMADHGKLIQKYIDKVGFTEVEKFIEACLSLENLIDIHSVRIKRRKEEKDDDVEHDCSCGGDCQKQDSCKCSADKKSHDCKDSELYRIKTRNYMDNFINTPEFIEAQKKKISQQKEKKKRFPPEPEKDVLLFLIQNAEKLSSWQRDILAIIREEAYYFAPQMATKIMNEGWASFWHSYIMSNMGLAGADGITRFAKTHAGVLSASKTRLNPYRLGYLIYHDILDRWNKGKHGPEYDNITDYLTRKEWDTGEMKGLEKIFQVRATKNDIGFIREFMTDDFIREKKFYLFKLDEDDNWYKIVDKDPGRIREKLLSQLINFGQPIIKVYDGNVMNRKELMLHHEHDGRDLDPMETARTLRNLYKIWQRPVYIRTLKNGEKVIYKYDGQEATVLKKKK